MDETLASIYVNFGMLGWKKEEIDNADIFLLAKVLAKLRGEEDIDDFDPNEAKKAIEQWKITKRG